VVLKEMVNIIAQKRAEDLLRERDGIPKEESNALFKKLMKSWTRSKAMEEENEIILDHNYDGIKELDNTLPPWWLYMFYATIIFGVIYLVRYEVLDGDDQETEYRKEVAAEEKRMEKYREVTPDAFDESALTILTDESSLKRGKAVFNLNCASCHAADGGGGIGPNLTDKYWILGGGIKNVYNTIKDGGRPGKGMISWKSTLKPIDIQKVGSYILSLEGTSPAKPKKAEGDLWEEE
jgi:cytochrome c oxidase cbb3-type subunit 3